MSVRRPVWLGWLRWTVVVVLVAAGAQRAPLAVDVLTFNAALLPGIIADTDQGERVARMAPHLTGYDVLVLQEVFVNRWREALLTELADAYPYRSALVGKDGARDLPWRQDGGIVILSRWPIEREATLIFGSVCSGSDCLADKGVAYVALRAGERRVHVFGTHAQSIYGADVEEVRATQFGLLREFMEAQDIPADEPVLIVGDLNVDAYTPELARLLELLEATWPPLVRARRYSWDPIRNAYAGGAPAWLDYVLVADGHATPILAWNRAVRLRDGDLDLSDHFAVQGRLVFGPP